MTQNDTPRRTNPLGIAALIAGIVLVVASIVTQALFPAIPAILRESGLSYRAIPFLLSLPPMVIALIATVLGVIALLLRDRARTAALIGTTLGASHLVVALFGALGTSAVAAVFL